ncbi:MAG: K(+)-transporting ATPase subunit C [Dolichospermum sp.]|nr:K(+)-transporting ATPase subunit C [Dolichospermum sp.]
MSIIKETIRAFRIILVIWLLTAIIYPLFILLIGQSIFPGSANGSIMLNINAQPIGSTLIGQGFISERYFHGRPSAVRYSQGKKGQPTGISGGSNLAPTNPELKERIFKQVEEFENENKQPVADLIYTSGSGLDPHISLKAARQQIERVAQARGIKEDDIIPLINKYLDGRFLGVFGEPGVNILRLNYALDLQEINRQQN